MMWWIWALDVNVPWPTGEVNVDYNGRKFNLMPQTDENFASIAVQASMAEADEVSKAVHRFLSTLSWIDGLGIRTLWSVGNPGWRQPTPRSLHLAQPGKPIRIRSNFDFLPIPQSEKAAKALAFFRAAVSSKSAENRFLQYFRIVELAYGCKHAEHPKFMRELIENAKLQEEALSAIHTLQAQGIDIGKQIVVYGRHAVAHGDDSIAIDPDIATETALLGTLTPIIAGLAVATIEMHFGVPSQRTYYQRHEYEIDGLVSNLSEGEREAVLASVGNPPIVTKSPVERITVGLRDTRYPALTGLLVTQAIRHEGGMTLRAQSADGIVDAVVRFDFVNRRLLFDVERGVRVRDDGSSASAAHGADLFELILGLVHNGELHVWGADADGLLGRQNPNLPVNIDPSETEQLLTARIAELRAQAASRKTS